MRPKIFVHVQNLSAYASVSNLRQSYFRESLSMRRIRQSEGKDKLVHTSSTLIIRSHMLAWRVSVHLAYC